MNAHNINTSTFQVGQIIKITQAYCDWYEREVDAANTVAVGTSFVVKRVWGNGSLSLQGDGVIISDAPAYLFAEGE